MATISVNKDQWESLSPDERENIIRGLREAGSLGPNDTIEGSPSVSAFDESSEITTQGWNPIKDILKAPCKLACDAAATAALAWCTANTAGTGLALCIAAADAARSECKRRC